MDIKNIPLNNAYQIIIKVDRKDIYYLCGLFDGYGRFGILRTIDRHESLMEILASPYYLSDIYSLLDSLAQETSVKILSEGPCGKEKDSTKKQ